MRLWARRAAIPKDLRAKFEELTEAVVAQIVADPLTHHPSSNIGVQPWAAEGAARRHAATWLQEQYRVDDARRTWGEVMEVAIVVLVFLEVWHGR
jgi:hypothetical protein